MKLFKNLCILLLNVKLNELVVLFHHSEVKITTDVFIKELCLKNKNSNFF